MTLTYGEAVTEGYGLSSAALLGMVYGDAQATGYPLVAVLPPPSPPDPTVALDAVHVKVYGSDDVLVADLDPSAQSVTWREEENGAGSGQLVTRKDAPALVAHPSLLDAGNYAIFCIGTTECCRLDFDGDPSHDNVEGVAQFTVAGPGAAGVLDNGRVEPEYGFRREAGTERFFNYGSRTDSGHWWIAARWVRPVGRLVKKSIRWTQKKDGKARHFPTGWGTRPGKWIYLVDPDKKYPDRTAYFTATFTMPHGGRAYVLACCDDSGEVMLDGEVIGNQGVGDWRDGPLKVKQRLEAGTHTIAAMVENVSGQGQANYSGLLLLVGLLNDDGDVTKWLLKSNESDWWVTRTTHEPAWLPSDIAWTLIGEGVDAGFFGYDQITRSFTDTRDSANVVWPEPVTTSLQIGDHGLSWLGTLAEKGFDWYMSPRRRLDLWVKRGVDRSAYLTVTVPTSESGTAPDERPVNSLAARSRTGWATAEDSTSIASIGRRAAVVDLGGDLSQAQTLATVKRLLPSLARPSRSFTVTLDPAKDGPLPYRDFNVSDVLMGKMASDDSPLKLRCTGFDVSVADASSRRPLFDVTFVEVA